MVGEPTRPKAKLSLTSAIAPVHMPTNRAALRHVPQINNLHKHADKPGLVLDKEAELLIEPPVVKKSTRPDARELLQDNRSAVLSGLLHHTPGNHGVHGANKVPFLRAGLSQVPPGRLGAPILETLPEASVAKVGSLQHLPREPLARAVGGKLGLSQVDAQHPLWLNRLGLIYQTALGQVELPLAQEKPRGQLRHKPLGQPSCGSTAANSTSRRPLSVAIDAKR